MNIAQAFQSGKSAVLAPTGVPVKSLRPATAENQPIDTTSTGFREALSTERRRNVAGAPCYRGLRWDC